MNLLACQPLYAPILGGLGMYSPVVVDDATPAIAKPVKPENPVTRSSWSGSFGYGSFPGFGIVDTRLSDQMYRRMANHPMIIKVKTRICKPVEDGIRTIEVVDQGAGPELCAEIKKAAEQDLLPRLNECVPGSMESLLYGKWLYETVWSKTADGRIAPVELQSVLPGEGTLHVDGVRRFAGYDINGQFRDARYGRSVRTRPSYRQGVGSKLL